MRAAGLPGGWTPREGVRGVWDGPCGARIERVDRKPRALSAWRWWAGEQSGEAGLLHDAMEAANGAVQVR